MKTDDIDKIIAEALEAEKNSKGKRQGSNRDRIATIRKWLNTIFMIGFVAAVIIYFAMPEQKVLFFSVGFSSVFLKLVEFYLRFMF